MKTAWLCSGLQVIEPSQTGLAIKDVRLQLIGLDLELSQEVPFPQGTHDPYGKSQVGIKIVFRQEW